MFSFLGDYFKSYKVGLYYRYFLYLDKKIGEEGQTHLYKQYTCIQIYILCGYLREGVKITKRLGNVFKGGSWVHMSMDTYQNLLLFSSQKGVWIISKELFHFENFGRNGTIFGNQKDKKYSVWSNLAGRKGNFPHLPQFALMYKNVLKACSALTLHHKVIVPNFLIVL